MDTSVLIFLITVGTFIFFLYFRKKPEKTNDLQRAQPEQTDGKSVQWEYENFVYECSYTLFGPQRVKIGKGGYTRSAAREQFWRAYQQQIRSELQKWLDEGWEPVDEIGPPCIQLRKYWYTPKPSALALLSSIILKSFKLPPLPLWWPRPETKVAEPTRFRLKMRRPRAQPEQTNDLQHSQKEEILPEEILCPDCGADLRLNQEERIEWKFSCHACKETFVVKPDDTNNNFTNEKIS